MANWITVNGRHIDLDDPNNPVTGSGNWATYGKGDNKSNNNAKTITLFHQTKATSLSDFSKDKRGAGVSDSETPSGIFLKDDDRDIGLEGKNQLQMDVTINKPLEVKNRQELVSQVRSMSPLYRKLKDEESAIDDKYIKLNEELEDKDDELYSKYYYAKTPEEKAKYKALMDENDEAMDNLQEEWKQEVNLNAQRCQMEMTRVLKEKGYDSVIIEKDGGSFGRSVKSYIVFDLEQLKEKNKK